MKKIIFFLLIFSACKKEQSNQPAAQVCKTCEVHVKYQAAPSAPYQNYIESSTVYCNGEWSTLDGKVKATGGTVGGIAWSKITTTTCH